ECPSSKDDMESIPTYEEKFICKDGFSKVYYQCVDNSVLDRGAMYFSSRYEFNVWHINITDDINYTDYYFEFSFKMDPVNYDYVNLLKDKEYYLIAPPHFIYQKKEDHKFYYYNNKLSGDKEYELKSIKDYEWNKIVIHNEIGFNEELGEYFQVFVYVNNLLSQPDAFTEQVGTGEHDYLLKGIAFTSGYTRYANLDVNYNYNWGCAWYRNIRYWDGRYINKEIIQNYQLLYTNKFKANIFDFDFSPKRIEKNYFWDNEKKIKFIGKNYPLNLEPKEERDDEFRENYSTDDFDYSYFHPGQFIDKVEGTVYTLVDCYIGCKRCYDSSDGGCYECLDGYILKERKCLQVGKYFFKTPTGPTSLTDPLPFIEFKDTFEDKKGRAVTIATQNPITITVWVKFIGVELNQNVNPKYGQHILEMIILDYYKDSGNNTILKSYFAYDHLNDEFILNLPISPDTSETVFRESAKNLRGKWFHLGFSLHRKEEEHFPSMFNFMLNQKIYSPSNWKFKERNNYVDFTTFAIGNKTIALYALYEAHSSFFYGTYGHITASINTHQSDVLSKAINLYALTPGDPCVDNTQLKKYDKDTLAIQCVGDYFPYAEEICTDEYYLSIGDIDNLTCINCRNNCRTNCFEGGEKQCSCSYKEKKYWIQAINESSVDLDYFCNKIESINFAFYPPARIDVDKTKNDEYSLEFWIYIYEYVEKDKSRFKSIDVAWGGHARIEILPSTSDDYIAFCYPNVDIDDLSLYKDVSKNVTVEKRKWVYLRCAVDRFRGMYEISKSTSDPNSIICPEPGVRGELDSSTYPLINSTGHTPFYISDNSEVSNYGFSFIREVKLTSSYSFNFFDLGRSQIGTNAESINKEKWDFILHYFPNSYAGEADIEIKDLIEGYTTGANNMPLKNEEETRYHYVDAEYENLIICPDDYRYDYINNTCVLSFQTDCNYERNNIDDTLAVNDTRPEVKCLRCKENYYLSSEDKCVDRCGYTLFEDDLVHQCRTCDPTCFECNGKYNKNCTSCVGDLYHVPEKNMCVEDCGIYDLYKQQVESDVDHILRNWCVPFICIAHLVFPFENTTLYSINFTQITFNLSGYDESPTSAQIVFERELSIKKNNVKFNITNTTEEAMPWNSPLEPFQTDEVPIDTSLSPSKLVTFNINEDYPLTNGAQYHITLIIYKISGSMKLNVTSTHIIEIDEMPKLNEVRIFPSEGYDTTKFIINCNECTDDNTPEGDLEYQITYQSDINDPSTESVRIPYIPRSNLSSTEQVLTFPFEPKDGELKVKYYIRCYCRDSFLNEVNITKEITIHATPAQGGEPLAIKDALKDVKNEIDESMTTEQLKNRAEMLESISEDYKKENFYINRTSITGKSEEAEINEIPMIDPETGKSDEFCNLRGDSYLIDKFKICYCNNYNGIVCQIDSESFSFLVDTYEKLRYIVMNRGTDTYNILLTQSMRDLMIGASRFMSAKEMDFMLSPVDYITHLTNSFPEDMIQDDNIKLIADTIDAMIEYGLTITNDIKRRQFMNANLMDPETELYNNEDMRKEQIEEEADIKELNSYFEKVRKITEKFLFFLASKRKNIRIISRNINLYAQEMDDLFKFKNYFSIEKESYEAYFDATLCLEDLAKIFAKSSPTMRIRYTWTMMNWKVSPYYYDKILYGNNVSPTLMINLYSIKKADDGSISLEEVYLNNCGKGSEIEIYFPENSFKMTPRINRQIEHIAPYRQIDPTGDYFKDPVYINEKGEVFDTTPAERIANDYVNFNLSCRYYSKDADTGVLDIRSSGCDYNDFFEDTHFILCKCSLLKDFVSEYYELGYTFSVNSRFFFVKHFPLVKCGKNYKNNPAFAITLALSVVYVLSLVICTSIECYISAKMGMERYLREAIIKMNLPYERDLNYEMDDLILPGKEVKNAVKDEFEENKNKRGIDFHQEHIVGKDINSIKVDVEVQRKNINLNKLMNNQGNRKKEAPKKGGGFFGQQAEEYNREIGGVIVRQENRLDTEQAHALTETAEFFTSNAISNQIIKKLEQ
ncbi:MAG: hypothetical protein MJ252_06180, partial [archaeon]|nr:hypothetical protein [archaeon]